MSATTATTASNDKRGGSEFSLQVFSPEQLGSGAFDGGKITEIKPIPFPREQGGSARLGPLFYWAWASARGDGVIGMHPHRGFEIVSYVLEGAIGHTDSAGNNRRVAAGGAQMMQTGSGISHQEEMYGERTDFFQIWFEPYLAEALGRPPVYADFEDADFARHAAEDGVTMKSVIGGDAGRIQLVAPARLDDVTLTAGAKHKRELPADHVAAIMVVNGNLEIEHAEKPATLPMRHFALVKSDEGAELRLSAPEGARAVIVTVPLSVPYPLSTY